MTTRTILVATDFEDGARAAADVAMDLARSASAEVTLLHVVPHSRLEEYLDAAARTPIWTVESSESAAERATRGLNAEQARLEAAGGVVHRALAEGNVAAEILRYAEEKDVMLIVLGRRSKGPERRPWLGGVSDHVVRHTRLPVLVVPRPVPAGSEIRGADAQGEHR